MDEEEQLEDGQEDSANLDDGVDEFAHGASEVELTDNGSDEMGCDLCPVHKLNALFRGLSVDENILIDVFHRWELNSYQSSECKGEFNCCHAKQ